MKGRSFISILVAVVLIILALVLAALLWTARRHGPHEVVTGGRGESPEPPAIDGVIEVAWDGPAACYPPKMVAECVKAAKAAKAAGGFGPVTPGEHATLAAEAVRIGKKHGVPISADKLIAIRNMEVALAARFSGLKAQRHGEAIAKEYAAGDPVLAIAARHKIAPLAVLRQILVEEGYGEAKIRAMVANPETLPPRLAAEAAAVFESDLGSRLNADRIKAKSQAYEDAVGAYLKGRGLEFKTENDLRAEHEAATRAQQEPAPLLTPDFLFTRPVAIGGRRVVWLDAKDYPLYGGKLVASSLARQAEKYTARFGPGAMVFSGGLMCGAGVMPKSAGMGPTPLLLDGSHIRGLP